MIDSVTKVMIIVGEDQKKVPIDLVKSTQPFGESFEWIQVEGKGKNALDFFIAYYLGRIISETPKKRYIVYSKDTGFDPLIGHLVVSGHDVSRIASLQLLDKKHAVQFDEKSISRAIENLEKVPASKRPKKRSGLASHLLTAFSGQMDPEKIDLLIEHLFIREIIHEERGMVKYSLEKAGEAKKTTVQH